MITENMSLAPAWEKAWKDPVTKERRFATPLSLYAKRQPSLGEASSGSNWPPPPKGVGRGKGKKGAGKGKNTKAFRGHAATKTGEPICFRFNQADGCTIPNCKFKHVCSHCFDVNHNFIGCPKRRPAMTLPGSTDLVPMGARRFTAKALHVLYLFCGRPRPNSLAAWLRKLAQRCGLPLKVEAIDIAVRPFVDLSSPSVQEQILSRIKRGDFFAVVLTPPCSTFSRAPWRNKRGPRPSSFDHPDGFPTLRWVERRKARLGNSPADFSFAAAAAALDLPAAFLLLEQPEDLGTVRPKQRPSSM